MFNSSCLNKKDLILQTNHRSPTQHGLPGVYFKLEVVIRWDRFRLRYSLKHKAKLIVTCRHKSKETVLFHEQDKWESRSPYCSCSNFKSVRGAGQRFLLILENVPGQGGKQWGSGITRGSEMQILFATFPGNCFCWAKKAGILSHL